MKKIKISLISVSVLTVFAASPVAFALSTNINTAATAGVRTENSAAVSGGAMNANVGAQADVKADVKTDAKTKAMMQRIETGKTHAAEEIDRRISALSALGARIEAMVKVSAAEKTNISNFIQGQVTLMNNLKTKIAADTDSDALKADIKSITESYRVFVLVIPQGHVIATTDAMVNTSDLMNSLGMKLQARIAAAGAAGKDVKVLNTLIADYAAKISDARVQAQAAVTLIAPLKPDNGDKATMDANKKAFADARAKIKAGREDLKKAREDAGKIIVSLKKLDVESTTTASSTTSVQH